MNWRKTWIDAAAALAVVSLIVCAVAPVLCFAHYIDKSVYITWLDAATVLWFLTSPFWFTPGLFGKKFEAAGKLAAFRPKPKQN
jgi:hypothetical protein